VVACGGNQREQAGSIDLATAAEETTAAGTVSFSFSRVARGGAEPAVIEGHGALDLKANRALITLGPLFQPYLEAITDGANLYNCSRDLASSLGKSCVKLLRTGPGSDVSSLLPYVRGSPIWAIDLLRGAKRVDELKRATVRGIQTTRYRVTVDLDRALESLPQAEGAILRLALERKDMSEVAFEPFDVWIDDQNLVRRVKSAMSVTGKETTEKTDTRFTLEFYDYGKPVSIKIPSADQIADLSELPASPGTSP
jgi:hypothetical protein